MECLGTIKRGDSFSFTAHITDTATGNPLLNAIPYLKCHGRYSTTGKYFLNFRVEDTSDEGVYLFEAESTDELQINKKLYIDIEYNRDGVISSSETFYVEVEGDITT